VTVTGSRRRGFVGVAAVLGLLALGPGRAPAQGTPIGPWESPLLQNHPLVGRIYDVGTRRWISPDSLVAGLRDVPYVLIGEKHDNPDHHHLELWLIEQLASTHRGLVFEMLDEGQREAVATLTDADSLEAVRRKLAWPEKGWDFAMYGPLIEAGLRHGMAIGVGNPARAEIMDIYRRGDSALAANPRFASGATVSVEIQSRLLDEIYESHCRMEARERLGPMVHVQAAKDASMTHALLAYPSALLITGGGHADLAMGVPTHLSRLAPARRVGVVQLREVSDTGQTVEWYGETLAAGNYVWFTPKLTDRDYCEDMKPRN
jgi:uncharacterized iron-regulated protein